MLWAIWYPLYNLKYMKKQARRSVTFVKLQASAWCSTKSITPPWVFFTLFKFYKWCQIAKDVSYFNPVKMGECRFCRPHIQPKCY